MFQPDSGSGRIEEWELMHMKTLTKRLFLPLFMLVLITGSLWGQDSRGQILGRVLDPSGAAVVGASVKAISVETAIQTVGETNQTGDYLLPFLIPGTYKVTVDSTGFRQYTQTGIVVRTGDRITVNVALTLGANSDTVTVTGEAPLVDMSSAGVGKVIDSRRINELPTLFGNPMGLVALAPGITSFAAPGTATGFDYTQYSVDAANRYVANGAAGSGNNQVTIDGAPNVQGTSVAYNPPVDLVQEMKVDTTTVDVSKGFTMGAYADITMKSGANQYHGTLLGFIQNTVLNANPFFSNRAGLPNRRPATYALEPLSAARF